MTPTQTPKERPRFTNAALNRHDGTCQAYVLQYLAHTKQALGRPTFPFSPKSPSPTTRFQGFGSGATLASTLNGMSQRRGMSISSLGDPLRTLVKHPQIASAQTPIIQGIYGPSLDHNIAGRIAGWLTITLEVFPALTTAYSTKLTAPSRDDMPPRPRMPRYLGSGSIEEATRVFPFRDRISLCPRGNSCPPPPQVDVGSMPPPDPRLAFSVVVPRCCTKESVWQIDRTAPL